MPPGRETQSSNVHLTLAGVKCGPVRSVAGGVVSGEVVIQPPASGAFQTKHLSAVRYEPFVLEVGLAMARPVYDWAETLCKGELERRTGSLVTADYKLDAKTEREFMDALLVEARLPVLDAAAKDQGFLTLTIQPELTKEKSASGKLDGTATKAKQWLRNGFRLQIDGLDCTKVTRIEPLSVKRGVAGDRNSSELVPTLLEFSNVTVTLSEVSAQTWFDWHEDFVIKGNNGQPKERSGTLQLLAADAQTELARVKLFGLGIYRIAVTAADPRGDKLRRVTAELYCERMELAVKA